jgi:YidC/Oxa1 family membrane protein insertase
VGILNPIYDAVAWVLKQIYGGLSPVFGISSGWTWALSIVILVVLMRLIMVPLFIKQMHTTRAMSALAPQMQALRKKYKNDKQTLQQETMKLYQEAGVNPLMGCLPVVLQLPVFFALFSVLRAIADWKPGQTPKYGLTHQMVESAQHAKILGATIADKFLFTGTLHVPVEAKVVIFIAVLISMATTFMTVRQSMKRGMMPAATPDNPMGQSQKYMMYIMPVFALSGLYWQFGLVLYWVTTNLWTLGQQWVLFRRFPQPAAAGAAGAAGTAVAPSSTARAVVTQRKRPNSSPTPSDAGPPEDARPEDARQDARRENAPRDRAGSNGGSKRNSNGAQPRSSSRRTTGSSPARSAPPGAAPSPNGGGGMLRRLGKKNAEPEPPPEPEVKLVRQQRQRQSRSKRSGKR